MARKLRVILFMDIMERDIIYLTNKVARMMQIMESILGSKAERNVIFNINENKGIAAVLIFIILNTVKITAFNMFMISPVTLQAFVYKAGITFLLMTVVYTMLFSAKSRIPFIFLYVLQAAYIFINLAYYFYFHSFLHINQALALSSESMGAASDLAILIDPKLLINFLDLPAAVYIIFRYTGATSVIKNMSRINKLALTFLCFSIICITEGWNYIHQYSLNYIAKANDSASESLVVQRYGTLTNSLTDMELNKNDSSMISQLKYGQHIESEGTDSAKPNIVIIQVESMDSNAVDKQHDGKYIMPYLHSLAVQNVFYPYMLSYHEAGGTSDSEFSVINSVEPLGNYPAIEISSYNYPNSIVRQFDNNSYKTAAFHGDIGSYYNRSTAYAQMGYWDFFDLKKMGLSEAGWGAPDSSVFSYAENWLKNQKQPFFAYTITMTSHGPFTNADNYYNNTDYDDVEDTNARKYMNSMSYVDQSLEEYIKYIRANFKNTYIIIYGDHTPDVNNADYTQASFIDADKYFEFVPLIIVTPDNKNYREDKFAASFLDIAPTIANASGIDYSIYSDGIDLLNRKENITNIPYRGGSFDRYKLFDKVSNIK